MVGHLKTKQEIEKALFVLNNPKPQVEEIQGLGVGFFFVMSFGRTRKCYVWPSSRSAEDARSVALSAEPARAYESMVVDFRSA